MRPKSIATVVDSLTVFSRVEEIFRSVETTSISLTERMNSVLPELKGPVTTILTVCIMEILKRDYIDRIRLIKRLTSDFCSSLLSEGNTRIDGAGWTAP